MSTSLTEYITNINLEAGESETYMLKHQPASGASIVVTYTIDGTSTTETFTYGTSASGTYITYDGDVTFTFTAVTYDLVGVSIVYTGDVIYYAQGSDKSRKKLNNIVTLSGSATVAAKTEKDIEISNATLVSNGIDDPSNWVVLSIMQRNANDLFKHTAERLLSTDTYVYPYAELYNNGSLDITVYNYQSSSATVYYWVTLMEIS